MTTNQSLQTLNNPKATKEQLRQALAAALGVTYEIGRDKKATTSDFAICRDTFLEEYKKQTNLEYSFGAKDGVALSNILKKIAAQNVSDVVVNFQAIIWNLPNWYKQNTFSLPTINNKFNDILANIKQNGIKQTATNTDGQSIAERFRQRQAKG